MRFQLRVAPPSLKQLNQIRRRLHIQAETTDELDRSAIDHTYIRHSVIRRVLHRDGVRMSDHFLQTFPQFRPPRVRLFAAGQTVQRLRLDPMHQTPRFTRSRDEIKPTPRRQPVPSEPENAVRQRIAVMVVVEEPPIQTLVANRLLNRVHIQHLYRTPPISRTIRGMNKASSIPATTDTIPTAPNNQFSGSVS